LKPALVQWNTGAGEDIDLTLKPGANGGLYSTWSALDQVPGALPMTTMIHGMVRTALAGTMVVPLASEAVGQTFGDSRDKVRVEVVAAKAQVPPGADLPVAIIFDLAEGWHIYAGDKPLPEAYYKTVIEAVASDPAASTPHTGFIEWPDSHEIEFFGDTMSVYEGRAVVYLPVTIHADAPLGKTTILIKPGFQTCDDVTCLQPTPYPPRTPGEVVSADWQSYGIPLEIEIVPLAQAATSTGDVAPDFAAFDASVFSRIRAGEKPPDVVRFDLFGLSFEINAAERLGLVLLLIVAALGGFLLNLTPCVLPVIPLKIMSLSKSAGNRRRTLLLGFMMSLGVVGFWLALGLAIAFIRGFTATNQLFQYPAFTIGVGVVIAIMAVGMCGLFTLRLPQFVYHINPSHDTLHGSFGFGVMTAVLSTPCTAPFMGAAAAWAATQERAIVLSVFATIGFGMALPYLILAAFPALAAKMPRTGPASELIKQVMGLLMLAAAAYFVGVGISGLFHAQHPEDPPSKLYWWIVFGAVAAAGAWLILRTFRITRSAPRRLVFGGLGSLTILVAVVFAARFTAKGPIDWVYYTPERLADARAAGDIVVMEFTAEWCLNCKALEESVLRSDEVASLLNQDGITPIKVDLTGGNVAGNAMLKKVGRLTIPLLVIFSPDGSEVFKGDFYTVQQVLDAVREARGEALAAAD
jgi:thiol:disulfide interchange protein DsbD